MSQQYNEYLHEHISNVVKAFRWMIDHNVLPLWVDDGFNQGYLPDVGHEALFMHDDSKWSTEEYDAYDDYFYGKDNRDDEDILVIDNAFDYAWLHHIHHNKHHWQHWVLLEDEGKTKALEMPKLCVYEMIADWWSFSWKQNDLESIFKWYNEHKEKIILHQNTRKLVEEILWKIRDILPGEKDMDN